MVSSLMYSLNPNTVSQVPLLDRSAPFMEDIVVTKEGSLACNYRPVSLTFVPCKLLEHIVCSNIMAHLDEHKLLSDKQHAFRKWHSCETQLATVINDWAKILDNKAKIKIMFVSPDPTYPPNFPLPK